MKPPTRLYNKGKATPLLDLKLEFSNAQENLDGPLIFEISVIFFLIFIEEERLAGRNWIGRRIESYLYVECYL
jgi:hypothetical protein